MQEKSFSKKRFEKSFLSLNRTRAGPESSIDSQSPQRLLKDSPAINIYATS